MGRVSGATSEFFPSGFFQVGDKFSGFDTFHARVFAGSAPSEFAPEESPLGFRCDGRMFAATAGLV